LQQGLREGLDEGLTVESNPQDATSEPVATPRIEDTVVPYAEEEGSEERQLFTPMQDHRMDILDEELEGIHSNTNKDIEMFQATTESDLPMDISKPDQMEDIVAPPSVPAATRIPMNFHS
jgi:hypothetical protein